MSEPPRLLAITLSNIGDLVLTTPVLETLAERYPGVQIDVMGDARSIDLLAAAPWIGTLWCRDKRANASAQWGLLRRLRGRRYRLVVDLRTGFLPWLLRADRRLIKRGRSSTGMHAAADHFRALAPLVGTRTPPWCRLHSSAAAQADAQRLLAGLPGTRWLAVAPGANWPGKRWPLEHYVELLRSARADFDAAIVVGGSEDVPAGTALAASGMPLVCAAGRTSLPVTAALIARAALFVGNDSGPGHVAAALGVPTVSLFGPGNPVRYRPWGPRTLLLEAPGGVLSALTPAAVHAAAIRFVAAT